MLLGTVTFAAFILAQITAIAAVRELDTTSTAKRIAGLRCYSR